MSSENSPLKRYVVTFREIQNKVAASFILGTSNVRDGVSFMTTDVPITDNDVLHFPELSATSLILSDKKVNDLKKDDRILAVEEDVRMFAIYDLERGAKHSDNQIDVDVPWNIAMVNAPAAWRQGITGDGVKVAVIDTGIAEHDDLVIAGGVSFVPGIISYADDNGHGTHCAGVVAGKNSSGQFAGVAPNVSLYAVKVLDSGGGGQLTDVLAGLTWALQNGMKVVSLSLGAPIAPVIAYNNAIQRLSQEGISVVCAAGNQYQSAFPWVGAPANSHPDVIAVGAIDKNRLIGSFSSRGTQPPVWNDVTVVAPGVRINSTWFYPRNAFNVLTGTSMACPHISGAVALLYQKFPNLSPQQVKAKLLQSSILLPPDSMTNGVGLLDCEALIK